MYAQPAEKSASNMGAQLDKTIRSTIQTTTRYLDIVARAMF